MVPALQSSQPGAAHSASGASHMRVHPVPREQGQDEGQATDMCLLEPAVLLEHVCEGMGHSTAWLLYL